MDLWKLTLSLDSKEARIRCGTEIERSGIELIGKSERLVFILPQDYGLEILMNDLEISRLKNLSDLERFSGGL